MQLAISSPESLLPFQMTITPIGHFGLAPSSLGMSSELTAIEVLKPVSFIGWFSMLCCAP
jgi:hypothetical protein